MTALGLDLRGVLLIRGSRRRTLRVFPTGWLLYHTGDHERCEQETEASSPGSLNGEEIK